MVILGKHVGVALVKCWTAYLRVAMPAGTKPASPRRHTPRKPLGGAVARTKPTQWASRENDGDLDPSLRNSAKSAPYSG